MFAFRRRLVVRSFVAIAFGIVAFNVATLRAAAQAGSTAHKTMDISAFAGYVNITPDYDSKHDTGFTFGVNVTRYFRFPIKPSLEARANFANGPTVNEHSYVAGVRGQMDFGRVHPYGDFLIGVGTIHYNFILYPTDPGFQSDNSVVKSPGGGVDVDVYRDFGIKADFQGQFWKLGTNDTLQPNAFTFAVVYHPRFRQNYRQVEVK